METKFTPGPWSVETVPTQVGHCHKIMPLYACLYVDHRGIKEADEKTVTAKANAALIAAAPEMYAELQGLSESLAEEDCPLAVAAIEKILAKARGAQ